MFLHIGGDVAIPLKTIITIVDVKTALKKEDTVDFFKIAKEEGFFEKTTNEEEQKIKSYVVTDKKIYLSPISSFTLLKRANHNDNTINF